MDRHNENAMAVAKFLQGHDKVERVIYPDVLSIRSMSLGKTNERRGRMIAFLLKDVKNVPLFLDSPETLYPCCQPW